MANLFDVCEVNIEDRTVRLLATDKDERNAEAVVMMAVARRGCDEAFYSSAPAGKYKDGDKWEGHD